MAKKITIPKAGNTGEVDRLNEEVAKLKALIDTLNSEKEALTRDLNSAKSEATTFRLSLDAAAKKIKTLEESVQRDILGEDGVKEGYVTIASCPLPNGVKPLPVDVDGIRCIRTIDKDGICFDDVPVKTAIILLSEGSGFARYLTGPVASVKGKYRQGFYMVEKEYFRYAKKSNEDGSYSFVRN